MFVKFMSLGAILVAGSVSVASASSIDAQDLLEDFNTIALGDLNASSETEGTVFVGGNMFSNGYTVNPDGLPNATIGSLSGSLIVGGNITGNPVNINSGDVVIGGSSSAIINHNGGGTTTTGASIPGGAVADALIAMSQQLTTYSTTAGAAVNTVDQNLKTLTSGAGGTGELENIAVLNLSESETSRFFGSGNLTGLFLNSGVTTIINAAGSNINITGNFNFDASNVLINFYEATVLTLGGGAFGFGILAPNADIFANAGGVNGVVVGNNITQRIEFRPVNNTTTFSGTLPTAPQGPVSSVPLPAAGWLLFAALSGLVALRRRTV